MKMTIDKVIAEVQQQKHDYQAFLEEYKNEHVAAFDMVIDIMRKYQLLTKKYNNRLCEDMTAMLEDLRLELSEIDVCGANHLNQDVIVSDDVDNLIQRKINALQQQKINALKGEQK